MPKHKFIIHAMTIAILLIFAAQILVAAVSMSSRKNNSGIVYADTGPVSGAIVSASGSEGSGSAITGSSGQYSIDKGLKTGTYTVSAIKEGYLITEIEDVPVTVGQVTSGKDIYLTRSGGISGKVTDSISGQPLQSIMVTAFVADGGTYGWTALTDASGNYNIATNLATGTYNVSALFPEGHVSKSMGGIAVTAGIQVTNKNLALDPSGIISGRVTAASNGAPLANASVYASGGGYFGFTQTNATGHYRISNGLGSGTYMVTAMYLLMNIGYAEDVSVTAGVETPNVDISINVTPPPPSGIITGKVTDTSSNPITNAQVTAQGSAGNGEANTDENGEYVISTGLGTGSYTVTASASGYESQTKSSISVTVDQVTQDVNFQLSQLPSAQSGTITGTVTGEANAIPEFQYPIGMLLVVSSIALVIMKSYDRKTRHL